MLPSPRGAGTRDSDAPRDSKSSCLPFPQVLLEALEANSTLKTLVVDHEVAEAPPVVIVLYFYNLLYFTYLYLIIFLIFIL